MKRIIILTIMLGLGIAIPVAANAAIYDDGNNEFIRDGKVIWPTGYIYSVATYDSRGRIVQILVDRTYAHSEWYEFDYHGNTDSVKEMRFRYHYGSMIDVYQYNEKGEIISLDKYASADRQLLYEHREYGYEYYHNSDGVKHATRTIINYNPVWAGGNINTKETNCKTFDRKQNLRKETNTVESYTDINGEATLVSIAETIDKYSNEGVMKHRTHTYKQYNPETGELIRHEVTKTTYDKYGNIKTERYEEKDLSEHEQAGSKTCESGTPKYTFTGQMANPPKTNHLIMK